MRILTLPQVATLLQVSERTVKRHWKRLGGFHPAGIRVLRFRLEDVERACFGPGGAITKNVKHDRDEHRHGL